MLVDVLLLSQSPVTHPAVHRLIYQTIRCLDLSNETIRSLLLFCHFSHFFKKL